MTPPHRLEEALDEIRSQLSHVLTPEERKRANRAWTILQNEAPVEFEEELPDEIGHVLTDDELENIQEYLAEIQVEIEGLYISDTDTEVGITWVD